MDPEIVLLNPRRRKRRSRRRSRARRLRNPRRLRAHRRRRGGFRVRRRRLRNPRLGGLSLRGVTSNVMPAVVGAAGALALDVGMAYLPLPSFLQSGWGKILGQLLGVVGLGFVAGKIPGIGARNAQIATLGALTIVAYNALKPLAAQTLGDKVKGLSGLADFSDYSPAMGAYMNPAPALLPGPAPMGAYMQPGRLGAYMSGGYSDDMFG